MRTLILLPFVALIAACTVGPNYAGPPKVVGSSDAPARFVRGADATLPAAPVVAKWWTAMSDPLLDSLEDRALSSSPSIAVAQARVRQARSSVRLERANLLPSGSANGTYVHGELPGINLGGSGNSGGSDRTSLDFYNVGFDASWEVDLFGGQRRTAEAARATLEASEASAADAQVQLTAEVAQAYVNLRDTQTRLGLVQRTAELQRRTLDLTRQREARGVASLLDVERLEGQLRTTEAQVVPMQADAEAYMNALAVLTGSQPGALDTELTPVGMVPLPPPAVAVGDPSALLQRRPDIRAAERKLASSTAKIGAAEAARFPKLSFMGIIGLGGSSPSDIADLSNISALALPQLQWNFFDFGRTAARVDQARGVRDEDEAQYRQTVLQALQDAEDSLSRFGHRRESLVALAKVKASAERASNLMGQRYRAGTATLIDSLDAERQRVQAEQNLAAATAGLSNDFIALQKALGLGWQP